MNALEHRKAIEAALNKFPGQPLAEASSHLLEVLGYTSKKRLPLKPNTLATFLSTFSQGRELNPRYALPGEWKTIDFLFQLTDDEIRAAGKQQFDFESKGTYNGTIIESYLFFAIELTGNHYSRTALAGITREVNKLFNMPALILFRYGETLTLSIINRRLHKREEGKDVLEKVTLIQDISCADTHRAHIEILYDLSLGALYEEHRFSNFVELHAAWQKTLDTSALNKRFFQELANWYFWSLPQVKFPKLAPKDADGRDSLSLIRLLTRVTFCWFLKEKGLLPDALFDPRKVPALLNDFGPKESTYYKAILQNLFFATLNQDMDKREFRKDGQHFMAHNLYRYRSLLKTPGELLKLFAGIPFMNGGLFECLDKTLGTKEKPEYIRIDGFSDRDDNPLKIPNDLFFGDERVVDLSGAYGDKKYKSAQVAGLIHIFARYKFTVAENTPIEEEIALDPELLGKVFENLLAAYNPETGATARKQTGSFYTPREIVNYMVDESLIASLKTKLETAIPTASNSEERLRQLFAYNDQPHLFGAAEVAALIEAIDHLKILDPACGSGAFPMGVLHKLVFVLSKLDPGNERWKARQLAKAGEIPDSSVRERVLADIEQTFGANELDYGRKLYLIENCIYGVDIQPIAVQISKLRFFISLIVDQKMNPQADNLGIRPLPNLETKFVAANTLIGIKRPGQQLLRNPDIGIKETQLRKVREEHFLAKTPAKKGKCREQDAKLRAEIAELLKSDGWDVGTARKLASWDPYDQNMSAGFFDSEWMFGITEGFDVVIGNPPYGMVQDEELLKYFSTHYMTCEGRIDIYEMFWEQAVWLARRNAGRVILIIPSPILSNVYSKRLRRFLLDEGNINEITNFGMRVFHDPTVHVCIIGFAKGLTANHQTGVRMQVATIDELARGFDYRVPQSELAQGPTQSFDIFIPPALRAVLARIESYSRPLADLCFIRQCIKTGDDDQFVATSAKKLSLPWRPSLRGRSIERYETREHDLYLKYGDWLARNWQNQTFYETPKLAVRETGSRIIATLDENHRYFLSSLYAVYPKDLKQGYPLKYLLAIINSAFATWYVRLIAFGLTEGAFTKIRTNQLGRLPIPTINVVRSNSRIADRLITLVDRILVAKQTSASTDTTSLEREIDQHVYALYSLTLEEIRLVEESAPLRKNS